MNLSLMAIVLWAAGFVLNAALLSVLLYRRRYKTVPWFTLWIASGCVYTIALFLGYRFSSHHVYAIIYWSSDFVDLLLQVAVVSEIARIVLRRSGRWVEGARARIAVVGAVAPLAAFGIAVAMKPAAETALDAWEARASIFSTILICLLFTGVMAASQQLGLGWRSHIMREGYGLTVWALVAFATDTLHAYWRTMGHFTALEHIRMVAYLGSLVYWAVVFWLPEKEPTGAPITGDEIKRLKALASRLEYPQSRGASSTNGVLPKQ